MERRATFKKWYLLAAVGAAILVISFARAGSGGKVQQPIAFSHKKHTENHVSCEVCHPLYERYPTAGIPGVRTCIRCHETVIYRTPEKDKIQQYREAGQEIPWTRIYRIEPDIYGLDRLFLGIPNKILSRVYGGKNPIYFSHRRHTSIGKVECKECHGDVANMGKPIARPYVPIEMDRCISCHKTQQGKVSVDCAACHR